MGTRLDSRPIEKDISTDNIQTNNAMKLEYNLENVQELYFSKYDNGLVKMKGIQVTSASTNKSVLSFNNTTYVFDKIIITNDFDKISKDGTTSPSNYDIAMIFSFTETNGNRNLFLTIPLLAGSGGSTNDSQVFVNELLDEIKNVETNNTSKISLDKEFDLNNILEYNSFNSNQYIYYSSSGTSLFIVPYLENSILTDNNFLTSDYTAIFSLGTHVTSGIKTTALYIMETPPQKVSNILNELNMSDIYIDCSPISSDASYQIIEPRKLKLMTNVFSNADKLIQNNLFYKIIIAIVVLFISIIIVFKAANPFIQICMKAFEYFKVAEKMNKLLSYKKFIDLQNIILRVLNVYSVLAVIAIISLLVLSVLPSINTGEVNVGDNIMKVFRIIMWLSFIIVFFLWIILMSSITMLYGSFNFDVKSIQTYLLILSLLLLIGLIIFFVVMKMYITAWNIIDNDAPSGVAEKIFYTEIWVLLLLFIISAKYVFKKFLVPGIGVDNGNSTAITDNIKAILQSNLEKSMIYRFYQMMNNKRKDLMYGKEKDNNQYANVNQ